MTNDADAAAEREQLACVVDRWLRVTASDGPPGSSWINPTPVDLQAVAAALRTPTSR